MQDGERQVAPDLSGIRRDHLSRYEFAAKKLHELAGDIRSRSGARVVDFACGVGYGGKILAAAGHRVTGYDADAGAIQYAHKHYAHANFCYGQKTAEEFAKHGALASYDAAVSFETIEHIEDPLPLLRELARAAPVLLASVPNETVFPYTGQKFHFRHYTADEFQELLNAAGWEVTEWWGQEGPESEVERDVLGRTLIAVCRRSAGVAERLPFEPVNVAKPVAQPAPEKTGIGHVVILGLGPSAEQYMDLTKRLGGRRAFADQVWAINALGDVLACDMIFHMDDVRVQAMRAEALPQSNIAQMVKWLSTTKTPVMTSRAHPDYPALVEFPLQDVINSLGYAYFNGTAAYAVAYAIYKGASKISLFGCDFTLHNSHNAEKGRGCLEFWLGFAAAKGIALGVADSTTLLDTVYGPKDPRELGVYGYDMDHVFVDVVDGSAKISLEPREKRPTAAEIEARYDHSRPTVPEDLLKKS